jgi:hypothetical protein
MSIDNVLVYIENKIPFADVKGYTYLAKVLSESRDKKWYDVQLLTKPSGEPETRDRKVTISVANLLVPQRRSASDIVFYQPAQQIMSNNIEYQLTASGFLFKDNHNSPLRLTTSVGYGSGIYGRHRLPAEMMQSAYMVDGTSCYPLIDQAHGDSLTNASLQTNYYTDRLIEAYRAVPEPEAFEVQQTIDQYPLDNLVTLWGIVMQRSSDYIMTKQELSSALRDYVLRYLQETELLDSMTGQPLAELPINAIMRSIGYDGVVAADSYNNSKYRGCVSYDYQEAELAFGGRASY